MGALRDCEAFVDVFWGQPANSVTALGFVAAGLLIILRTDRVWVGVAAIATGIGSFLFHGWLPDSSELAHDATLSWLLLVVAGTGRWWERWTHLRGLAAVTLVSAIPRFADPVGAILALAAVVTRLDEDRSIATVGPLTLLTVVAVLGRLGSTGGPLCDPGSLLQPHAVWHLGAAVALAWWAIGTAGEEP
jgi:hypothetical protein